MKTIVERCGCGEPIYEELIEALHLAILHAHEEKGYPPEAALAKCQGCGVLFGLIRGAGGAYELGQSSALGATSSSIPTSIN